MKGAYSSVMSHLIGHVLPTPEPLWVDANLGQEEVCSSEEVTESLVVDGALLISSSRVKL
jgi:hypothetical protein